MYWTLHFCLFLLLMTASCIFSVRSSVTLPVSHNHTGFYSYLEYLFLKLWLTVQVIENVLRIKQRFRNVLIASAYSF